MFAGHVEDSIEDTLIWNYFNNEEKNSFLKPNMIKMLKEEDFFYRPFHKTLPRSSAFVYWISVRFYETESIYIYVHVDCRYILCKFN